MPRRQPKTRAETTAEEYFPVSSYDLKHTVEKIYAKESPKQEVKQAKSAGRTRKKAVKKSVKPASRANRINFEPQKINLKKEGYELVITEKPQAAAKIASSLGKSISRNYGGVSYYEVDRHGKKILVACAVGHLFTLMQKISGSQVPVFDLQWVPNYLARKKDFTKRYYDTILKLAKSAGSVTIATDYDIEGEVIGLNIVRYLCGQEDANRMKFSTLTSSELNSAYEKKSASLNWGQAIAGETRHYLDWIYGINLSRALMDAIKTTGAFKIMSIGRVQGPTLNIIVQKERQIQEFKPQKYWQVFIRVKNSHELELKYDKDIFNKKELEKFENLKGEKILLNTLKKSQALPPNPPFNLTVLQTESYRLFGFVPSRTLQIAQSLYLGGLISYPRTSSQKLPISIEYKSILRKLAERYKASKLITREKPVEGAKSDPAHPSIYPTGENLENIGALGSDEMKVYDLIVRRFLALFCDDAVIDKKVIFGNIDGLRFSTSGSSVKRKGWMEIYPIKIDEKEIPDANGEFEIIKVWNEEKETQPPKRFSPASIVTELEKRNLGTKATRAAILETLYDRSYIQNNRSIEATPLGMSLVSTLERYSPIIIDEKLTRQFEKEMDMIQGLHKGLAEKEKKIIDEAEVSINRIIGHFDKNKREIGKELLDANLDLREQQKRENILNKCPKCGQGNLAIMYSKKNNRYFVACNKYPECRNTYWQ
ncbi:MAG: DNA topoisomerase I, partial [Candidatus Pacearchaeota archaeon]|nr:DNA topoisomerase I [Candidatus Pacearchaeota archaeon]